MQYVIFLTKNLVFCIFARNKYKYVKMYFKYKYKIHVQNVFQIQKIQIGLF